MLQAKLSKTFGNKYIFKSSIKHFSAIVLQGGQFFSFCLPVTISVWGQALCVPLSVSLGNNILKHVNKQKISMNNGMEAHMGMNKKSISNPCLWCTNLFTMMSIEVYTNDFSFHSTISNMVVYRIDIIFLLKKSNTTIVHDQLWLSLHINQDRFSKLTSPGLQYNKCNMKTVQSFLYISDFKYDIPDRLKCKEMSKISVDLSLTTKDQRHHILV